MLAAILNQGGRPKCGFGMTHLFFGIGSATYQAIITKLCTRVPGVNLVDFVDVWMPAANLNKDGGPNHDFGVT